jgi:hypothetical protein
MVGAESTHSEPVGFMQRKTAAILVFVDEQAPIGSHSNADQTASRADHSRA